MLLLILFFGLGIILIILGIIFYKYTSSDGGVCFFGAIICLLAGIIGLFTLIGKNASFNTILYDYENTVALVETYNGLDYGNMSNLTEKIIDINSTIAKHKAFSNSKWVGIWYSKDVGALEPIIFKIE